jgi:N-acetylmuramoyl-L-alanine amidase
MLYLLIKWLIFGFLLLSKFAFGMVEIGANKITQDSCKVNIKGDFSSIKSQGYGIIITFDPREQPIVFNNCPFLSIDKKKRNIEVTGGFIVSKNCKQGNCSLKIIENGKETFADLIDDIPLKAEAPKINPKQQGKLLIAIDAGHGGHDPGAIGKGGTHEKVLTLKHARYIKKTLENAGYKVLMVRNDDEYLKLHERIDIAILRNADIFISIHADSAKNRSARGATIYTLSPNALNEATKKADARLNLSGNFVEGDKDEDLMFNILNIQHSSNVRQSFEFADILRKNMVKSNIRFTSVPIRSADFAVLKAPTFPAILLEIGYISNWEDEKLLNSNEYMQKIANSIKKAVDEIK